VKKKQSPKKLPLNLWERVKVWRQKALLEVQAIESKKKRSKRAAEYYDCDQSTMKKEWPEMEPYLPRKRRDKRKRDRLIDPKQHKQNWERELTEELEDYYTSRGREKTETAVKRASLDISHLNKTPEKPASYPEPKLPTLEQYKKLYGPHVPSEKETGKAPRFTGPMNKTLTREELFKETYPELLDESGKQIPSKYWEEIQTERLLPRYFSYQERKEAGQTVTRTLKTEEETNK